MNAFINYFAQHGKDILEGATGTAVFVSIAKWIPDWPLNWEKMWNWGKHSVQEIAAQRSGNFTQPETPAQPERK